MITIIQVAMGKYWTIGSRFISWLKYISEYYY